MSTKIVVIDYIVPDEDPFARHPEFDQILDVALAAHECGREQINHSPLHGFLPPSARFILPSALRHHDHGYPAAQTAIRGNERSEIIPAINRDNIWIRLLQSRPERSPKLGVAWGLICRFLEQRNFCILPRRGRCAPCVITFG